MTTNRPYGVSVVIATWNSGKVLFQCLERLASQTYKNFEIIIVDNGSTDSAIVGLDEKYPTLSLHIEPLKKNTGFAAANNIGARLARGNWLALLNTDAFPEPDWLEKLVRAAEDYPSFSCFSSRQIQAQNPLFLDGAGDAYHVNGMAWKHYLGYPASQYGLEQREVFSSCGAAALYSRQAFLDVGGFDEDFFSYLEDVDLGFRLRLQGYHCLYVPEAIVHHIGSATLGVRSDFALYYSHRNLVWSFIQNMPPSLLWRFLFVHIIANFIYLAYYTFQGRGKILWKAKMDAIRGLPKALHKRREIQLRRKANVGELLKIMERGWLQPYLLGYHLRRVLATTSKK